MGAKAERAFLWLASLLLQQAIVVFGVWIGSASLSEVGMHHVISVVPWTGIADYSETFLAIPLGVFLACVVNWRWPSAYRVGVWVWVLPMVPYSWWLSMVYGSDGVLATLRPISAADDEGIVWFLFTLPIIGAVSYSLTMAVLWVKKKRVAAPERAGAREAI